MDFPFKPQPPEDADLRNIIDKLAQFVARNGPDFEQMTKNKQANNPKFRFLFGGEYYQYYQYRVDSERDAFYNPHDAYGLNIPSQMPPQQHVNSGFFPGPPAPGLQSHGPPPFAPMNAPPFGRPPGPSPMLKPMHHHHGEPSSPFPPHHSAHPFPPPPSMNHQSHSLPPPMFQPTSYPPPPAHSTMPSTGQPAPPPPFNAWNPPMTKQAAPIDPMANNGPPVIDSAALAGIAKAREAIDVSQKNLDAQHKVIMEDEKNQRIEEMIKKSLDDEVKRMCEDYSINLNEFDKILQPIIETCRKESIAKGKGWIYSKCNIPEHYEAVSKHLLKKVTRTECTFDAKLHLMYLINDLYNHCMRKADDNLRESLNKIIVPAFSTTVLEADEDKKQKMNKLLKLWEMNQYLDNSLLDQLKSPRLSLDAYTTSLYTRFSDQIQSITNEQTMKFNQMSKQHAQYVKHQESIIQQLQQTKPPLFSPTNGPSQMPRPPFSPSPSNSNVYIGPGPPPQGPMTGRPPMPPQMLSSNHGIHPYHPNQQVPPPQVHAGYPAPFSQPGAGLPPPNFYPNPNVPNTSGGPPFLPSLSPGPHLQPMPPHSALPGPGGAPPLPHAPFLQIPQEASGEEIRPPYFDMPAGVITQYIKLEDFDYKPINPDDVRIPVVTPPSERLLKALEAFYAPPSHEHPRNAEGWEKLGLYEFIKIKSKARQEYEEKLGAIDEDDEDVSDKISSNGLSTNKSTEDNKANSKKDNRSPSPPKRRYREFKEEKDSSNSTTKSMKNRSRSRSSSPHRERRNKSKGSKSRSSSRSRSRSSSDSPPRSRSFQGRRFRSRSPIGRSKRKSRTKSPPVVAFKAFSFSQTADPQLPLNESNKGHQLLKKMGWSGSGGLGANEHGIQNPISAGEVRDRGDQYRGIGTSVRANDPFESYRRNKGQAYIQRIKDARQ